MRNQPTYNRVKQPIGANEEITVHSTGNLVALVDAVGTVEIALGDGAFIPLDVGQTVSFQEEEFDVVRIRDTSGAANIVDAYIGRGEFFDLRFSAKGVVRTQERIPDKISSHSPTTLPSGATTAVLAANGARRELILTVHGGATAAVFVSSNPAAGATDGLPIQPGQYIALETTAAVYGRQDSGNPVNIYVTELEWT